jgi:hypothetical protein
MKRATSKENAPPAERTNTGSVISDVPRLQSGAFEAKSGSRRDGDRPGVPSDSVTVTSFKVLGAHFTWIFMGPLMLLLMLVNIVRLGTGWLTALDAAFFVMVTSMILCRWVDQRSGQGTKITGEPSKWEDFQRYARVLPLLAIGAWILANVLGNHLLQGSTGF